VAASSGAPSGGPPTTVEGRAPGGPGGIFGPTQRPGEAITTGARTAPVAGFGEEQELSTDDILREMYRQRPSPWLLRLLRE
jgi:hypothetical protein